MDEPGQRPEAVDHVTVGGSTAAQMDLMTSLGEALPKTGIFVVTAIFLLLFFFGASEEEEVVAEPETPRGFPVPPMPAGGAVRGAAQPLTFSTPSSTVPGGEA